MMSERQRRFRENYKADISPLYNGLLHVVVTFGAGIAAIWYCASQTSGASWEWLLAIPVFLAGNFVEWFMHRYVMHRRINVFALRAIYERHTRQHHQYFTDNEATIDTTREFRIVFFPWRVLITLGVFGVLLGYVTAQVLDVNAGYVVFINTVRRHHTAHPNHAIMMKYNMHLTFPIADWFLGTTDLDRGLLGHLFNGYSERHVKEELKPIIARFRRDDSGVTLDGPRLTQDEEQLLTACTRSAPAAITT